MTLEQVRALSDEELRIKVAEAMGFRGFVCPLCGSTYFGSSLDRDYTITSRDCHDQFAAGCRWSGKPEEAAAPYESDMKYAWLIVESMSMSSGWEVNLTVKERGHWCYAKSVVGKVGTFISADGDSIPQAICRLFLQATTTT